MPDQKTVPKPCCHVMPKVPQTLKAKKPLISRPGATAKGNLAQSPMANVAAPEAMAPVAKARPGC